MDRINFKPGDRVRLIYGDQSAGIPAGSTGTVVTADTQANGNTTVQFDNGFSSAYDHIWGGRFVALSDLELIENAVAPYYFVVTGSSEHGIWGEWKFKQAELERATKFARDLASSDTAGNEVKLEKVYEAPARERLSYLA